MSLTAKKAMRFNGRSLKKGDAFDAAGRWRRALIAAGLAEETPLQPVAPVEDLTGLRAEAASLGIHVDGRWGSARLAEAIATERQRRDTLASQTGFYQRRDMRAED